MSKVPVIEYYKKNELENLQGTKWWGEQKENIYKHVWPLITKTYEQQSYRSLMNLRFARMYANREIISLKAGNHMRIADPRTFLTQRQTYNVVKACVDSACAKISKDKPRPLFLTENGSWTLQQKAKRLSQFIQAVFATMGTGTG